MKSFHPAILLATCLATATSHAADYTDILIEANVQSVCAFTTPNAAIAFGTVVPALAQDVPASGTIVYQCTNGVQPTVTVVGGTGARTMSKGSDTLNYLLSGPGTPPMGTGFGSSHNKTLTFSGLLPAASILDAVAGTYWEAVTVTLVP